MSMWPSRVDCHVPPVTDKARSSREALMAVRQAFGDDAVVLSTRPCAEGVEVPIETGPSG